MKILKECNLSEIIVELLAGKTLIFPTETSYGLGCDATNQQAVDNIFKIKARAGDKPLLVVVPTVEMARKYLLWNDTIDRLANRYWPGPLTVVGKALVTPLFKEGLGEVNDEARIIAANNTLLMRQELRKNKTKAESVLWSHLKNKRLGGLKFRRQHGIGSYIVDFYQPDTKTIIEVDGDIHFLTNKKMQKDLDRSRWFESMGYRVIRFNNVDVLGSLKDILDSLYYNLTSPSPLLKKRGSVHLANGVVSNQGTVAVRVTANPVVRFLSESLGKPIVATSGNISGAGDIYNSADAEAMFAGRDNQPDIILDFGQLPKNLPSTLVDATGDELKVLRQGELKINSSSL